tara:strand:+ start:293 stop:523 length:231 start_codon:yes stop_codon:yes gene_type:complete
MSKKGFEAEIDLNETPNFNLTEEKSLNLEKKLIKKVDINVLKARAQEAYNKENRKNIFILVFLLLTITLIGIYLST